MGKHVSKNDDGKSQQNVDLTQEIFKDMEDDFGEEKLLDMLGLSGESTDESGSAESISDHDLDWDDDCVSDESDSDDDCDYDVYDDFADDVISGFVTREFYSDDLGLKVSTEPFDVQFLHGNSYEPLKGCEGTDLFSTKVNKLSDILNHRMEHIHNHNLFVLRERYMRAIQQQCVEIFEILDDSKIDTKYGRFRFEIDKIKIDNLTHVDEVVKERCDVLESAWQSKLASIEKTAGNEAKLKYMEVNGDLHDKDLSMVKDRVVAEIELDYHNSISLMNRDRRSEAMMLLDMAINEVLCEMSAVYSHILESEEAEYKRLSQEIADFVKSYDKCETV